MVTAQPMFSALRVRPHRAGPLRVLWLAALLLGLLYTHGVSTESAAGHTSPMSVSAAAPASSGDAGHGVPAQHAVEDAVPDEHDGDHEAEHPAQDCLSSQPEHGADLPVPCLAPLDAVQLPEPHTAVGMAKSARAVSASPPLTGTSAILRI
ncbi:hypothetical protein ACWIGX_28180 [Streptomyces nigrescens]